MKIKVKAKANKKVKVKILQVIKKKRKIMKII